MCVVVWGRAELRAGAAVVAIGVGSPVVRLGADGLRRREARAAVGRAEVCGAVSKFIVNLLRARQCRAVVGSGRTTVQNSS